MKVYSIAKIISECHGQGDYNEYKVIYPLGAYGSGGMPPIFKNKIDAENYIKKLDFDWWYEIIELDFIE